MYVYVCVSACPHSDEMSRLGGQEAALARQLEAEGAHNPNVLLVLHTLSRRIRPTQVPISCCVCSRACALRVSVHRVLV